MSIVAAAALVATGEGMWLALSYVLAGIALIMVAARAWGRGLGVPRSMAASALLAGLPLLWLAVRVFVEPVDAAARRHEAELAGAVLPGLVFGLLTGFALAARWRSDALAGGRQPVGPLTFFVVGLAATTLVVAAFMFANAEEGILLVSAALLQGVEAYQVLGDVLTIVLLMCWVLAAAEGRRGNSAATRLFLPAMAALCLGTAACAVLVGSNKLLLVVLVVGLALAALAATSHVGLRTGAALLAVVAAVAAGWAASDPDGLGDLLALTRLLDYGNVETLLDVPSIASRLGILEECGQRQFSLSPLLGDLAAEYRSCGDGHYLHSLLSVQTHLGLPGTALFVAVFARMAWFAATQTRYRLLWLPLGTVLGVGLISAYFTWMPVWFVIGLAAGLDRASARQAGAPSARPWTSIARASERRA
ncbi:MAG: hypothetical protein JNL30_11120 [Rubrivivax sp.]|nr:hypothetical protein [Rubrivivax sp.]